MIEYKSRSGEQLVKPQLGVDVTDEDLFDDTQGWCLACGSLEDGIEPDTHKDVCPNCGAAKLYGLSELALMGLLAFPAESQA